MRAIGSLLVFSAATALAGEPAPAPLVVRPANSEAKAPGGQTIPKDWPKPRSADPQAEEVVEAYLKATGGREALAAIGERYERFEVARHSTTGPTKAIFERYIKGQHMVREDWDMDVKVGDEKLTVIQVYNGKTGEGWTKMMGYVAPLEGNMIYMLTWDKHLSDFFLTWKQDGYALKYRSGEGSAGDQPCHVIDVFSPTGNQESRFFFSKKDGLLLKKGWRGDSQEGPVRSELFFSEYRKVNNQKDPQKPILFAFKQEQYGDGVLAMERNFMEVSLNSGLSDALFGRPEGPIFTGRVNEGAEKEGEKKKEERQPPWKQKRRIVPKGVEVEGEKSPGSSEPEGAPPEGTPSDQKPAEKAGANANAPAGEKPAK